jgi:hypothetical protein
MIVTAEKIIDRAAKLCGVKGRGRALSAEDANDFLEVLNALLDSWSANDLMIPVTTTDQLTLSVGFDSYTIGTGGTFNVSRPEQIFSGRIRDAQGTDHHVDLIERDEYNAIAVKGVGGRPRRMYYIPTVPLATIRFDSVPTVAEAFFLDSLKPLAQFATLATSIDLQAGFYKALYFNLAVDMAGERGRPISQSMANGATQGLVFVRGRNFRAPIMEVDTALKRARSYDINAG